MVGLIHNGIALSFTSRALIPKRSSPDESERPVARTVALTALEGPRALSLFSPAFNPPPSVVLPPATSWRCFDSLAICCQGCIHISGRRWEPREPPRAVKLWIVILKNVTSPQLNSVYHS